MHSDTTPALKRKSATVLIPEKITLSSREFVCWFTQRLLIGQKKKGKKAHEMSWTSTQQLTCP